MFVKQSTGSEFVDLFSREKLHHIDDVIGEIKYEGQPDYVDFILIDNKPIAFLGLKKDKSKRKEGINKIKRCTSYYLHTFRMVIPAHCRLVKVEGLMNELNKTLDQTKISMKDENGNFKKELLYDDVVDKNILLNIGSIITDISKGGRRSVYPGTDLEPCGGSEYKDSAGDGYCSDPTGTYSVGGNPDSGGLMEMNMKENVTHDPIIFYLDKLDHWDEVVQMNKTDEGQESKLLIKDRLENFFNEWELDDAEGFFLIPQELPDKGVNYLFIPNVDNYCVNQPPAPIVYQAQAKKDDGVRPILQEWTKAIQGFNFDQKDQALFVAIDDTYLLPIDPWCASVTRNAYPIKVKIKPSMAENEN